MKQLSLFAGGWLKSLFTLALQQPEILHNPFRTLEAIERFVDLRRSLSCFFSHSVLLEIRLNPVGQSVLRFLPFRFSVFSFPLLLGLGSPYPQRPCCWIQTSPIYSFFIFPSTSGWIPFHTFLASSSPIKAFRTCGGRTISESNAPTAHLRFSPRIEFVHFGSSAWDAGSELHILNQHPTHPMPFLSHVPLLMCRRTHFEEARGDAHRFRSFSIGNHWKAYRPVSALRLPSSDSIPLFVFDALHCRVPCTCSIVEI
jgi:hypothetical protein